MILVQYNSWRCLMTVKVEHLTGGYGKRPVIENINFELKR